MPALNVLTLLTVSLGHCAKHNTPDTLLDMSNEIISYIFSNMVLVQGDFLAFDFGRPLGEAK